MPQSPVGIVDVMGRTLALFEVVKKLSSALGLFEEAPEVLGFVSRHVFGRDEGALPKSTTPLRRSTLSKRAKKHDTVSKHSPTEASLLAEAAELGPHFASLASFRARGSTFPTLSLNSPRARSSKRRPRIPNALTMMRLYLLPGRLRRHWAN